MTDKLTMTTIVRIRDQQIVGIGTDIASAVVQAQHKEQFSDSLADAMRQSDAVYRAGSADAVYRVSFENEAYQVRAAIIVLDESLIEPLCPLDVEAASLIEQALNTSAMQGDSEIVSNAARADYILSELRKAVRVQWRFTQMAAVARHITQQAQPFVASALRMIGAISASDIDVEQLSRSLDVVRRGHDRRAQEDSALLYDCVRRGWTVRRNGAMEWVLIVGERNDVKVYSDVLLEVAYNSAIEHDRPF